MTYIMTTNPVRIKIGNKIMGGLFMKLKSMMSGAFNIVHNT